MRIKTKGRCFPDGTPRISNMRERRLWKDGVSVGYELGLKKGRQLGKLAERRRERIASGRQG